MSARMFDWESAEPTLPLQKQRVLAFCHIPADASKEDARGWLLSATGYLSSEVRASIVELHLKDSVLKEWRNGVAA